MINYKSGRRCAYNDNRTPCLVVITYNELTVKDYYCETAVVLLNFELAIPQGKFVQFFHVSFFCSSQIFKLNNEQFRSLQLQNRYLKHRN